MQVPASDIDTVLNRALGEFVRRIKSRRYGLSGQPREGVHTRGGEPNERHVSAAVRRRVYVRDHGQCTYVDPKGHRCTKKHHLVYDHILPIARGGLTTASNLRLLCPEHNQMEADRVLGEAFMRGRRERGGAAIRH
jgi:5-methylcytosine-specific restriction endonuclease McrA